MSVLSTPNVTARIFAVERTVFDVLSYTERTKNLSKIFLKFTNFKHGSITRDSNNLKVFESELVSFEFVRLLLFPAPTVRF